MPGICRLGDKAKTEGHTHGGVCCEPHTCIGPAVSASSNVLVNGKPALRLGDLGVHSPCCGPSVWTVDAGSGGLFINGMRAVRQGDLTIHCGISEGEMIEASGTVSNDSGMIIGLGIVASEALPEGVINLQSEWGDGVMTEEEAIERLLQKEDYVPPECRPGAQQKDQPHYSEGPSPEERLRQQQRKARGEMLFGPGGAPPLADIEKEVKDAKAALQKAKDILAGVGEARGLIDERRAVAEAAVRDMEILYRAALSRRSVALRYSLLRRVRARVSK